MDGQTFAADTKRQTQRGIQDTADTNAVDANAVDGNAVNTNTLNANNVNATKQIDAHTSTKIEILFKNKNLFFFCKPQISWNNFLLETETAIVIYKLHTAAIQIYSNEKNLHAENDIDLCIVTLLETTYVGIDKISAAISDTSN